MTHKIFQNPSKIGIAKGYCMHFFWTKSDHDLLYLLVQKIFLWKLDHWKESLIRTSVQGEKFPQVSKDYYFSIRLLLNLLNCNQLKCTLCHIEEDIPAWHIFPPWDKHVAYIVYCFQNMPWRKGSKIAPNVICFYALCCCLNAVILKRTSIFIMFEHLLKKIIPEE